ncbi:uncharacterized protein PpBr36_05816 [Pyricularia pennisetigena]|uniref:uncharacterized protein n=1 Tax=Pyricularia pennisetigena TaxID=1578925 RepID=UPI0011504CA7|nr:uncharacterized protein PpBr36_05816 [Pyricularia pennisetigena]TLS23489.1 hypothetical protein PpBr36_05816 [Pyricularia pennisetigena]
MDYPNLAVLQASVNATKAKVADLEGQLVQARDENAAREREMITAMLKQAKLPDRLESRSFRAEVNQIAEHWSRYGPSKSGLTFGTLICLCRSLPRTDWDLLQRHPETFREQAPSVNERLGTWKWEVWEWFRKFVNPELQKSCVAAMTFENFKDDLPGLNNQLQCIQRQTNAAETIQLPSATFQNPSGTPVDKVTQNERNESWSRKSPGTTSCNPRECNLADLVPVSRAALLSQPPRHLSSVASYANSESSNFKFTNRKLSRMDCLFRTLFDPRINHQFENGSAMTIIFGKEETLEGWAPLLVENPNLGHFLEKMKQDLNIGWNIG